MKTEELWELRSEFLRETEKEKLDIKERVIITIALDAFIRWIDENRGK